MVTNTMSVRTKTLGTISIFLALFGLAFYWYVPLGMILGLAGLLFGIIAWLFAASRLHPGVVIAGIVLSLVAIIFDLVAAGMNWETFTFSGLR